MNMRKVDELDFSIDPEGLMTTVDVIKFHRSHQHCILSQGLKNIFMWQKHDGCFRHLNMVESQKDSTNREAGKK